MNEKFTDGCLDSNRAVRICCFKIWCMIDFLEVGQSINVTRKYLHLLGFWEFIGRRCGEIKSSETQMFMLAVMQTGSYLCQPARGHPKTQAMQTADCADGADWLIFSTSFCIHFWLTCFLRIWPGCLLFIISIRDELALLYRSAVTWH